jgi:hypothetical protein
VTLLVEVMTLVAKAAGAGAASYLAKLALDRFTSLVKTRAFKRAEAEIDAMGDREEEAKRAAEQFALDALAVRAEAAEAELALAHNEVVQLALRVTQLERERDEALRAAEAAAAVQGARRLPAREVHDAQDTAGYARDPSRPGRPVHRAGNSTGGLVGDTARPPPKDGRRPPK